MDFKKQGARDRIGGVEMTEENLAKQKEINRLRSVVRELSADFKEIIKICETVDSCNVKKLNEAIDKILKIVKG